ncbi:MATE efflux family protein, partial [Violaceomyces palustris]
MSFTNRYGSSLTRDYALLQHHPSSSHPSTSHGSAQHHQEDHHSFTTSASQSLDGDDEHDHHQDHHHDHDHDHDGMSAVSMPTSNHNHHHQHHHAQPPNSLPNNNVARRSSNAFQNIVGIPSQYILGGSARPPLPPPPAPHHDPSSSNRQHAPPPPPPSNRPKTTTPAHAAHPDETTSLLVHPVATLRPGQGGAENPLSNYGSTVPLPARRASVSSSSSSILDGPGVSGWGGPGASFIAEPPIPDVDQIAFIAQESSEHIPWREAVVITKYTIPIWLTHLLELSLSVVSVFSLGHLGTLELAAASLSSMTANVSGFSVISGFISALDTILPSAYTQQPKSVGLWTQRMGVVLAGLLPLIIAIWCNAESILVRLGQDPEVAKLAGAYLRVLSIGLPGYAAFETFRRYLQAQGLMHAPTLVLLVVSPLNALANYLLVWGPESVRLGFIGAPLASAVSMWLLAILCFIQCVIGPRDAWDGWSTQAFHWPGIKPCLYLGATGMLSLAAEWWAWEIVGLVTAILGTTALAAQSVLLVSSSVTYQLPFGASVAAAVRIGNLLGAGRAKEAKISSNVALLLSLVMGGANSAMYLAFRKQWGYLFSSDPEVIRLVGEILPILALFQVADGVCGIAGGVLRGTGRQAQGAVINMTAYYVVGIPIGLALSFSKLHWGLSGLWWGLTIALLYGAFGTTWFITRTDWDWEVRKVRIRMGLEEDAD